MTKKQKGNAFSMNIFDTDSPKGFESPTALPRNEEESRKWQEANRVWWENYPMRYE